MSNDIQIVPLSRSSRDVMRFLKVSYGIYPDDPNWVAPLLMDLKKVFTDANPMFEHAVMQLWVARRNGQDVGRIAGIIDHNHNRAAKDPAAFFGFFESVNDPEVSRRLFDTVFGLDPSGGPETHARTDEPHDQRRVRTADRGLRFAAGPHDDLQPALLRDAGGGRRLSQSQGPAGVPHGPGQNPHGSPGPHRGQDQTAQPRLVFRPVRRKTLQQDLAKLKEVYNAAWQDNWGFVPMTDAEMDFMAARLKPLLMEGLIWLAEAGAEPVGFLLALPDYNIAAQTLAGTAADSQGAGVHSLPARLEVPAADARRSPSA